MQLICFLKVFLKGDFKKMSLTQKEKDFCRYFAISKNHREAAAKAGYAFAERSGIRLLEKQEIRNYISEISQPLRFSQEAVDGLKKIAFGSIADAIKLMLSEPGSLEVEKLDLFMISEIKFQKGSVSEIKFYDRIKALEALSSVAETNSGESIAPFIDAIFKGASALGSDKRSDNDEI